MNRRLIIISLISIVFGFALGVTYAKWSVYRFVTAPSDEREKKIEHKVMKRFARSLELRAEQKEQIREVFREQRRSMRELRRKQRPEMRALRQATKKRMRELLDPSQQVEFDRIIGKMEKRMRQHWKKKKKEKLIKRTP